MSNDDLLCGAPGPGDRSCTLPYGHHPKVHAFELELPTDLGNLLDRIMTDAEESRVAYVKARRAERIMFCAWAGMFLFYAVLAIAKAFE